MRIRSKLLRIAALAIILVATAASQLHAEAVPIGDEAFWQTWARTDKPVQDGAATRTWLWGPEAHTDVITEEYAETPGGTRRVQYFDKSRMEITDPNGDPTTPWYVSNGLLARELITGQMQIGDHQWDDRAPAQVNVAGDPDDVSPTTPTYASFLTAIDAAPEPAGSIVSRQVLRGGGVAANPDPIFASYGITHTTLIPETNHTIASVFWDFLRTTGPVYENGSTTTAQLFDPLFYATGFPITEPYWSRVRVGGTQRDVLIQCFERRCMTWTPSNPAGWQVEMGNVGQHYYRWRYEQWPGDIPATEETLYTMTLEDWAVYDGSAWVDGAFQYTLPPNGSEATGYEAFDYFWTTDEDYQGTFADIVVGIDVRSVAPTPPDGSASTEACLLARVDEAETDDPGFPEHRYGFCKDQSGHYRAWYLSNNPAEGFQELVDELRIGQATAETWTRLEIATHGSTLWFLVDGDIIATIDHAAHTTGEVGFEIVNYSPVTVAWQFRNLEVRQLQ